MSYFADIVQYVRLAWKDFLVNQRQLFLTLYCLKLLELWLLMPLISMGLSFILSRSGYIAISNIDIFEFILTPIGLVYLLCSGAVTVTLAAFDQAIVHRIAENQKSPAPRGLLALFFSVLRKTGAFFEMSILKLVALTFVLLPFIFLGYVTYTVFLAEQDINYYIKRRPPEYWYALILGAVVLTVAVMTTLFLLARLSLALPILLYEKERVWSALRKSNQRVRGHTWQVALCLVGWLIVAFILGFLLELAFSYGAAALLKFAGERPVALMLLLLLVQALLVSKWSIVTLVGLGLLTRQMYLKLGGTTEAREHTLPDSAVSSPPVDQFLPTARKYLGHRASMILVFLVVAPIGLWFTIAQLAAEPAPVQVTAHRGHAKAAPENTVSAIRKAIESGADFAEIDVLQTADGVVVLHHDRDLKRVSGDPRRVREVPYSELRQLDAGGWFSPAFSGEPIPTLAEVMQVAKGRIQLNIEVKYYGPDPTLMQKVAQLIRENQFEDHCIVTTFDRHALEELKRLNPKVRRGLIIAHAIGDISKLDIDIFSVRADWLSDEVIRKIKKHGKEVHVWTINDPKQAVLQIKRGVNNILTSNPDLILPVRNEWAAMEWRERLVLASRLLLGLDP